MATSSVTLDKSPPKIMILRPRGKLSKTTIKQVGHHLHRSDKHGSIVDIAEEKSLRARTSNENNKQDATNRIIYPACKVTVYIGALHCIGDVIFIILVIN